MTARILAPSREAAETVLLLRDLARIIGDEKALKASAGNLIEAAERVEVAVGGQAALKQAADLQKQAEQAVASAQIEADAIIGQANAQMAASRQKADDIAAKFDLRTSQADERDAAITARDIEVQRKEAALLAREDAVAEREKAIGGKEAEIDTAVQAARAAEAAANAARMDYEGRLEAIREAAA